MIRALVVLTLGVAMLRPLAAAEVDGDRLRAALARLGEAPVERPAAGVSLHLHRAAAPFADDAARRTAAFAASWSEAFGLAPVDLAGEHVVLLPPGDDGAAADPAIAALSPVGHTARGVAVLIFDPAAPEEGLGLLLHELAHLASQRTFAFPLAPWLEEGLAEALARSQTDPDGRSRIDRLRGGRQVEVVRSGVLTRWHGPLADQLGLAELDAAGRLPPLADWTALGWDELDAPERRALAYSLAGSFVRFLLLAEPDRAARFRRALARAAGDAEFDLDLALADELGEVGALDRAFRRWLAAEAARARD